MPAPTPIERLDGLRLRLPRAILGCWPTPVHRARGLEVRGELWVKREDRASPVYGGNKVRKLELLLAGSAGPVLTVGAAGSHHVLATALHARALGRDCIAVLVPQPLTAHAREVLDLNLEACAEVIRLDRVPDDAAERGRAAATVALELARHHRATIIAPGGSTPLGVLGFVNAGLELADQVAAGECPRPDAIYLPLGTGGTAAGLALGLGLAGLDTEVVAVRVATRLTGNERFVRLLAGRAFRLLARHGLRAPLPPFRVRIVHDAVGRGYGHPTPAAVDAVHRAADAGLPCETTYTGKALAVLLAEAAAGSPDRVRMFLDTYGPIDHLRQPQGATREDRG